MLLPPSPSTTHGCDWFGSPIAGEPEIALRAANRALTSPVRGSSENRFPTWSPTSTFGLGRKVALPIEGAPSRLPDGTVDQSTAPVTVSSACSVLPAAAMTRFGAGGSTSTAAALEMSPPSSIVAQSPLPLPSKANSVLPAPTMTLHGSGGKQGSTSGEAGVAPSPTCQRCVPMVLIACRIPSLEPKITFPGGSGCGSKPRITAGVVLTE